MILSLSEVKLKKIAPQNHPHWLFWAENKSFSILIGVSLEIFIPIEGKSFTGALRQGVPRDTDCWKAMLSATWPLFNSFPHWQWVGNLFLRNSQSTVTSKCFWCWKDWALFYLATMLFILHPFTYFSYFNQKYTYFLFGDMTSNLTLLLVALLWSYK